VTREQRLVFGEVAQQYQDARPTYPAELYDIIAELSGIRGGGRVLDVGAGTGKATESLVARGYDVAVVEPSPEMAAVLQSRLPDVQVQVTNFEECAFESHSFALITAAQSWHWVDPKRGPQKAHGLLRAHGWLALFWNAGALDDCEWHDELQPIYARITPEMTHERLAPQQDAGVQVQLASLRDSGLFEEPVTRDVQWHARYTTDAYIALLATASNHRMLPDEQRAELHSAIADAIDARGGTVEHPYRTDLVAFRVK
jgi:SAM-dependent methyltransferase